jgi:geranylgeranyl pyrophosphate synthase
MSDVSISARLAWYAALVEGELSRWLAPEAPAVGPYTPAAEPCGPVAAGAPPGLLEAMRHAVFPGGKRLRPVLLLATADALGGLPDTRSGPDDGSGPAAVCGPAAAVELVHCYSLVHDDLPCMDDDDLRRGRPTVHRLFGEAMALLAGDSLLTLAFQVLAASGGRRARRLVLELATAAGACGMAGGQARELLAGSGLDRESLFAVHAGKTGALIRAAVRMGAIAAGGATRREMDLLTGFAADMGLAFQVTDDLLDLEDDRRRARTTLATLLGAGPARALAEERTAAALARLEFLGERGRILRYLAGSQLARGA